MASTSNGPIGTRNGDTSIVAGIRVGSSNAIIFALNSNIRIATRIRGNFGILLDIRPQAMIPSITRPLIVACALINRARASILAIRGTRKLTTGLSRRTGAVAIAFPSNFRRNHLIIVFCSNTSGIVVGPLVFAAVRNTPANVHGTSSLGTFTSTIGTNGDLTGCAVSNRIYLVGSVSVTNAS